VINDVQNFAVTLLLLPPTHCELGFPVVLPYVLSVFRHRERSIDTIQIGRSATFPVAEVSYLSH